MIIGVVVAVLAVIGVVLFFLLRDDGDSSSDPDDTTAVTIEAAIPPAEDEPNGLGSDDTLNALAQGCYDGDMADCDDLFRDSPAGSQYEAYGDTCAGRQAADTPNYCVDVFD